MNWMQWNASYRECVQRFVRGDRGLIGGLMTRIYGSCDLFPDDRMFAYRPFQSVNYVSSHDGFTMADLVSFTTKNNWANGHQNTDGAIDFSCNCGWEGNQRVPGDVIRERKQRVKNYFCILMLSAGTPMFRMGDEFLHTQHGNSNPYNQDNGTSWLDWTQAETNSDVLRFVRKLIAFRQAHPSIGRSRFWRDDIKWYGTSHRVDLSADATCLAYCLHGKQLGDYDLYVMLNNGRNPVAFGIQEGSPGQWKRIIDTTLSSPCDFQDDEAVGSVDETDYQVMGNAVVVLVRSTWPKD